MESDGAIVPHIPGLVVDAATCVASLVAWLAPYREAVLGSLAALLLTYAAYRAGKYAYVRRKVGRLRAENDAARQSSESRLRLLLGKQDPAELAEVAALPWDRLVGGLQDGSITAVTALAAYWAKAIEVQGRTNAVTAWIEDALSRAEELDRVPAGERGPLHGVPVSIKECYDVAGTYSTAGMALLARQDVRADCLAVRTIRTLGGVPFCKTNVPQVMYSLQCSNPLYGTTCNPHGAGREAGGSSGGEGALVGGGGSILGLGSDVGGSLRNPPAFCGAFSLKPTAGRHLSQLGVAPYSASNPGVTVVGGWIAASARGLGQAWRAVWAASPLGEDTGLAPVTWDEASYQSKPRVGYYTQDGLLRAAPGCERAVREAVGRLQGRGYEVVPIEGPDIDKVLYFFNAIVLSDMNRSIYRDLSWDMYDSTLSGVVLAMTLYKLPWILKKLVVYPLLALFTRVPGIERIFSDSSSMTEGLYQRDALTRAYLATMTEAGVDLVLCPGQQLPAPPTGTLGQFVAPVLTYIPWNVMNFPAGIAPVTRWSKADTAMMASYPRDDLAYKLIHSYCQGAEGLPLAVQVVGRPWRDEQVLRALAELETATGAAD